MTLAYCHFVRLYDRFKAQRFAFQDFFISEIKFFGGVAHGFAPFKMSPGAGTTGGDRSEEAIVFPLTELTADIAASAVTESRWTLTCDMVLVDPISLTLQGSAVISDRWNISSWEHDTEAVVINLSSPFDAVGTTVPKERMTTQKFGILPVTGNVKLTV